jgi:hypothetical protein
MKRLACLLCLLVVFLGACSQNRPGEIEALAVNLTQLKGLSNNQQLFLADPNNPGLPSPGRNRLCLVNSFKMPGQGFNASGVKKQDGGLTYDPLAFTQQSKTAFSLGSELKTGFFSGFVPSANTAILVVDDFGKDNPATQAQEEVYTLGTALFTQSEFNATTIENLQSLGALSHGALVFRHVNEVVRGSGLYTLDTAASSATKKVYVRTFGATQLRLEVIAVNVNLSSQQDTATIANSIETKLKNVSPLTAPRNVVINMSFALMPCTVYADYEAWDLQTQDESTFEDYMIALAAKNSVNKNELVVAIIESTNRVDVTTGKSIDPLAKLIDGTDATCAIQCSAQNHVYVASAGNYSLGRSMYPANWPKVVNVTGSSVDDPSMKASFFNRGEVMHVAATLKLNPDRGCFLQGSTCKPVYYIGTSFSGPNVSAYSALDIAITRRCAEVGMSPLSELASDVVAIANRPLEDINGKLGAVSRRCGVN